MNGGIVLPVFEANQGSRNVHAIIARMAEPAYPSSDSAEPSVQQASPARSTSPLKVATPDHDRMICERCGGAEMYRMHAVWRCPACGFKTDCCGW